MWEGAAEGFRLHWVAIEDFPAVRASAVAQGSSVGGGRPASRVTVST